MAEPTSPPPEQPAAPPDAPGVAPGNDQDGAPWTSMPIIEVLGFVDERTRLGLEVGVQKRNAAIFEARAKMATDELARVVAERDSLAAEQPRPARRRASRAAGKAAAVKKDAGRPSRT